MIGMTCMLDKERKRICEEEWDLYPHASASRRLASVASASQGPQSSLAP